MPNRYYEDFTVGDSYDLSTAQLSEAEIIAFAEKYDPQQFHVDPEAAEETQFGSIFASGWHTASVCMRLFVEGVLQETAVVGGVGVDELRWRTPVYPGDELNVTATVAEKELWDDTNGLVTFALEARNQRDEQVIYFKDLALLEQST